MVYPHYCQPHQCKLTAFQEVKKTLTQRQRDVLMAFKRCGGEATMHEIGLKMMRPLHTISGRFGELVRLGYIKPVGVEKIPTRQPRTIYKVVAWPEGVDAR